LSTNCSAPFSLLDPHACSLQPSTNNVRELSTAKVNGDTAGKRKATTPSEDARAEKRARKGQDEKDAQLNVDGAFIPVFIPSVLNYHRCTRRKAKTEGCQVRRTTGLTRTSH
jgi:hypothetical protein